MEHQEWQKEKIQLIQKDVLSAFPKVPPPPLADISTGNSVDSVELRHDFCNFEWWSLPDELIYENFGQLPFFTPVAFHYYFPAFLLCALKDFDSFNPVLEFVIYSFNTHREKELQDRFEAKKAIFTPEQRQIIGLFLEMVVEDGDMSRLLPESHNALQNWMKVR